MASVPPESTPTLPTLEAGCHLLEMDERATGALQSLAVDHLLMNEGTAYWVDAAGHARADTLARIAPSNRLLDRIQVARGFTAYQHTALVDHLEASLDETTTLVVVPAVDALYRADSIRGPDATEMLRASVNTLAACCDEYEIPILLTCTDRDDLSSPVAEHVDETIRCEATSFGPRFIGPDTETLVYPVSNGHVQTTLAFWQQVLSERASTVSTPTEVATRGAN